MINHRKRLKQIISFDRLRYGTITPTDIDGLIEYKNKAYAIIEIKGRNVDVPKGQMITLERLAQELTKQGKMVAVFICEHDIDNPEKDVIAANTIVRQCWFSGAWRSDRQHTLKQRLDNFIGFADSF